MIWFSFLLALVLLLLIARKSLWLALIVGAFVLGIFNLELTEFLSLIISTITDPAILLLALAVGLIPMIGGGLQVSGLLADLVDNLQMKRKVFLGFSPALMGLLPIPGGALLSAPMLSKAGDDIPSSTYTAINVWFRHILILIYPLGALLPCSKMANLNIYSIILFLLPAFAVLFLLGYFFFLFNIRGNMPSEKKIDLRKIIPPLFIIIIAPLIHIMLSNSGIMDEISLLIGISTSLILTYFIGRLQTKNIKGIFTKMKPWKYFLIIIGVFLFLHIFKASNISEEISKIIISRSFLIVFVGGFLGFVTGRVQLPIFILVPIFLVKFGNSELTVLSFAIMYVAVYIGYMISPVHPCVSVSVEYFKTSYKDFAGKLFIPCIIGLGLTFLASILFL
jgi:integral membrane protein (TIGR00529 family)